MALKNLVGSGFWAPTMYVGWNGNNGVSPADVTLDADEEEFQIIGAITIDGGGSKTFGTSGSKLSWATGASITFAANSTLRVGVKQASSIDNANGPVARATIGAAAFDVYDDLVGGTDTISSTTGREDTMSAGTPFTVTDGDLIAICFHLNSTSGTPSVKVRGASVSGISIAFPSLTLVTSGPTYTAQAALPNVILTFDDGTLGWIDPSHIFSISDVNSGTIGNGNIFGNVFRFPFAATIDMIAATLNPSTNAANFALDLYSTPLGTPSLIEGIAHDANIVAATNGSRMHVRRLTTPRVLTPNTDYLVGVRQTTATSIVLPQGDVSNAAHFKPSGMGADCYAANSTAGATFAAQNSGNRRYKIYARICALSDDVMINRALFPSGVSPVG